MAHSNRRLEAPCAPWPPRYITDTPAHSRAASPPVTRGAGHPRHLPGIAGLTLRAASVRCPQRGGMMGSLIRSLTADDYDADRRVARKDRNLIMTLAPENAPPDQIAAPDRGRRAGMRWGTSDCDSNNGDARFDGGCRMASLVSTP